MKKQTQTKQHKKKQETTDIQQETYKLLWIKLHRVHLATFGIQTHNFISDRYRFHSYMSMYIQLPYDLMVDYLNIHKNTNNVWLITKQKLNEVKIATGIVVGQFERLV